MSRRTSGGRRMWIGVIVAIVVATTVGAGTAPAAGAPGAPSAVAQVPPVAPVQWERCLRNLNPTFQCGSVEVPLDYDEPDGRDFEIPMIRLPATDPAHRIGSLFVNPGGPGGSGFDLVIGIGLGFPLFTPEVLARFDIVGFDPRGIVRTKPLRCFDDPSQWIFANFPITPEQEAFSQFADRYLADACEARGGRIQDHMSTANVARDLDVMRQAVGDAGLTYVGYSYGSFLGTVYANLFPQNVRAVVVDGVLDPIAWTTGAPGEQGLPFSTRLRSALGAQATLEEFFRLCDAGGPNCAFGPGSVARFAALADRLRAGPIEIEDPETGDLVPFLYQDLIGMTLGALYNAAVWPDLAQFLAFIESQAGADVIGQQRALIEAKLGADLGRNVPRYRNDIEGFPGVICLDSDNPDSYEAWSQAGAAQDEVSYFGRLWTWASSTCAVWIAFDDDRYMGPFTADTANPVLVVGTRFDPATRYEGAVSVASLLPNSALLTVDGWGHTSIGLSACANEATARYLVDVQTPAPGAVCAPDFVPFAEPPAVAAAAAAAGSSSATSGPAVRPIPASPGRF